MKNIAMNCYRAIALSSVLAVAGLACAQAQTTTTQSTTTTSSAGTVTEFTPGAISVRTESSASPISFSYSKTTTYVDENGNPVSTEIVKSGIPVTVFYSQEGDRMVASKVIVRKVVSTDSSAPVIEKKSTTTTTTTPPQ